MRPLRSAALLAILSTLTACRSSIPAFGSTPADARTNATDFFTAFEQRFDSVARDQRTAHARLEIGRYALVPGRLFADTSLWTNRADSARTLFVRSTFANGRYRFTAATSAPTPASLGDEGQFLRLNRLPSGDFAWTTSVEHAVGRATPAQIAAAVNALFTGAANESSIAALTEVRTAFPRAGAVLSQLLRLDSLTTTPHADGSTSVSLGATFVPDRLRIAYPAFATYLDRYVMPSIYSVRLSDGANATFFRATGAAGHITIDLRTRDGSLVSDNGASALPDSLVIDADFSAKYHAFRIGYANLRGELTIERGPHTRALLFRFDHEPAWHFPLALDKLIRSPLHRPFDGDGATMRLGVRDDLGPQTISFRDTHVVVRESAIMRWLGRLGATAFGDFAGRAETEENRFLVRLLAALDADVASIGLR